MISKWSAVSGGNKTLLQVMELLKVTNIRIEFLKLHTLGDDHIDSSMGTSDSSKKYYYALYNLVLRGSCFCYGHASSCRPLNGDESTAAIPGMVHGRCDCEHSTTGMNCEKCMDFYHDAPWRPAKAGDTSECRRKYTRHGVPLPERIRHFICEIVSVLGIRSKRRMPSWSIGSSSNSQKKSVADSFMPSKKFKNVRPLL